jgi:pimeloyl-ACP methyl ester carboxylesterase
MAEELQIRVHGSASLPTLVYLPGLHGDWTLIGGFREALKDRVRFVEFTYPRTLTWSLEDYAEAIERSLAENGITSGWLVGESFGSQIVWALLGRQYFQVQGIFLAGGFARHPLNWGVRFAEWVVGAIPWWAIRASLLCYSKLGRLRFRRSPETLAGVNQFISRRTELDRQAAVHRLRLIKQNDPCSIAQNAKVPIYAMTGFFDPIVQWWWVRPWFKQNCPNLKGTRIFWSADHTVLATGARAAARQVLQWLSREGLACTTARD